MGPVVRFTYRASAKSPPRTVSSLERAAVDVYLSAVAAATATSPVYIDTCVVAPSFSTAIDEGTRDEDWAWMAWHAGRNRPSIAPVQPDAVVGPGGIQFNTGWPSAAEAASRLAALFPVAIPVVLSPEGKKNNLAGFTALAERLRKAAADVDAAITRPGGGGLDGAAAQRFLTDLAAESGLTYAQKTYAAARDGLADLKAKDPDSDNGRAWLDLYGVFKTAADAVAEAADIVRVAYRKSLAARVHDRAEWLWPVPAEQVWRGDLPVPITILPAAAPPGPAAGAAPATPSGGAGPSGGPTSPTGDGTGDELGIDDLRDLATRAEQRAAEIVKEASILPDGARALQAGFPDIPSSVDPAVAEGIIDFRSQVSRDVLEIETLSTRARERADSARADAATVAATLDVASARAALTSALSHLHYAEGFKTRAETLYASVAARVQEIKAMLGGSSVAPADPADPPDVPPPAPADPTPPPDVSPPAPADPTPPPDFSPPTPAIGNGDGGAAPALTVEVPPKKKRKVDSAAPAVPKPAPPASGSTRHLGGF